MSISEIVMSTLCVASVNLLFYIGYDSAHNLPTWEAGISQ